MTEPHPQGEGDVHAQAATWFARLRTLPVSRETLDAFFLWKKEPDHAAAFDAVQSFWSKAGLVADDPAIAALTIEAFHRNLRFASTGWAKVALPAACAVLLAAGWIAYSGYGRTGDRYSTRVGEQRAVRLADGSELKLDTNTKLSVKFGGGARRVALEQGQASFTVVHDPSHPFIVDVGGARVTAIGTRFDVRRDGVATSVTLVEGRIRIDPAAGTSQFLVAGQQWSSAPGGTALKVAADVASATAWEKGRIVLDGRSLADAIAEVNRYSVHSVRLDAPHLEQARLSGSVTAGDTASFIAAATALLPLHAAMGADGSVTLVG